MAINANDFKISCSAIGQIMTNSRGKTKAEKIAECTGKINDAQQKHDALKDGLKSKENYRVKIEQLKAELSELQKLSDAPELSETAKTYCENWVKSMLYGKRKDFTSKETEKGDRTESDVIALMEQHYNVPFLVKNKERKENDFLTGECDVVMSDKIVDAKSSYDCFTFPLFENEIPEKDYDWQVNGYMCLWGKESADVFYGLVDMPADMIEKELRWKLKEGYTREEYEKAAMKYIYSHIDVKHRVKVFSFQYEPEKIEQIKERVQLCREYIQTLITKL